MSAAEVKLLAWVAVRRARVRLALALTLFGTLLGGAALTSAATNTISTAAGTGTAGFSGDGGPAGLAQLSLPVEVAATPDGGYLITDQGNSRVRRVSPSGTITTVAGSGTAGFSGDGGPATAAQLNAPNGLAMMSDGAILIADSNSNRVRRVSPAGTITTVAGTGAAAFSGDGGPATAAQLSFPAGLTATADGGYLIADNDNHRVRRVSPTGTITTIAGTGTAGFSGDGGPAISAQLNDPSGISVTPDGGYLIADQLNHRVRKVSSTGTITTVAGTGSAGFGGDGGAATAAQLNLPIDVAPTSEGGFVVVDRNNNRVRKVSSTGTITTVAGTGSAGFGGDGGAATAAQLNLPIGVAVTQEGDFLIADTSNHRVRVVDAGSPAPAPGPAPTLTQAPEPPPAPAPADLPPPVLGKAVNVAPVSGRVLVAVPRSAAGAGRAHAAQKGLTFVPLTASRQIPVGSFLHTRRGTVRLVAATDRAQRIQAGEFSAGVFQLLQSRRRNAKGLTELRLKGSSFAVCRRARPGSRTSAARRRRLPRRVIRRLRGNANGRFRTRGRYSAATVRGTAWITSDRCDGTLTKVNRGRVSVRDFRRKRTIALRAGKSYLARRP